MKEAVTAQAYGMLIPGCFFNKRLILSYGFLLIHWSTKTNQIHLQILCMSTIWIHWKTNEATTLNSTVNCDSFHHTI